MERNRFLEEDVNAVGEVRYIFKFGKYKGEFVDDVISEFTGRKYVEWMLSEIDNITDDVSDILKEAIESWERDHARR